ncbi:MAG: carboxylesterase/lipase family protein [Mycobacterium sp.]|nr:carboxylesterase/lipase family protein [Mycobacterium sp.]
MHNHTVRVTTAAGAVEGFTRDGVHRWRSIPYARPPVGPLRFRAPQPAEPWPNVRPCNRFAKCAPQQRRYTMIGPGKYQSMGEDCLTLNVVTPEAAQHESLPVMVFIHGGGYFMGTSALPFYDGADLARRGCVYVSINYRVGALGCLDLSSLSTADTLIDSNLFLRDLIMALRWVRDNIAEFGGDPGRVTLFGQSAGGEAVATMLAVPEAEGLFAQAISESPSTRLVRSPQAAAGFATQFARLLGVHRHDAARALMSARPSELVAAQCRLIDDGVQDMLGAFPIGPAYGDDILPLDPIDAMRRGKAHRVPLIVGTTAEEGRLFTRWLRRLVPTTEPMIDALLAETEPAARERITGTYPDYPKRSACAQLGGDLVFSIAAQEIAEAHGAHAPTYLYRYDYAPRTLQWCGLGATHATELLAVFGLYRTKFGALLSVAADRRSALQVTEEVQRRWCFFSRTGTPGDDWPTYSAADRAVMVLDRSSHVEFDPHPERRMAWERPPPASRIQ